MALIINDLHFGVQRSGGTTPQTQQALRTYLRDATRTLIHAFEGDEITVNGDMFDGFTVDPLELVRAYEMFADWLNEGGTLNLCAGNHDWNPRGDKISSFHLLCHFLTAHFPKQVRVFDKGFEHISDNVWVIPHQGNQELFNLEIQKAITTKVEGSYLLLHCNYKNGFAENSDHSLNLCDEQIGDLMRAGWTVVLGHEHQGYTLRGGRVIVVGNHFPSSVADCLGNDRKHALLITDDGHELYETWDAFGNFKEVDWRDLSAVDKFSFIRVTGDATAEQSADVVSAIAKLRQNHSAFVITNAVKIEGHQMVSDMAAESIESIKAFDVLGAIFEHLDEQEAEVVKGLIRAE